MVKALEKSSFGPHRKECRTKLMCHVSGRVYTDAIILKDKEVQAVKTTVKSEQQEA